jgi:hypothetical protein
LEATFKTASSLGGLKCIFFLIIIIVRYNYARSIVRKIYKILTIKNKTIKHNYTTHRRHLKTLHKMLDNSKNAGKDHSSLQKQLKPSKKLSNFARNSLETSRRRHKLSETVGEDQNFPMTPARTAKEPIDNHPLRTTVKTHGKGISFFFSTGDVLVTMYNHFRALSRHYSCGLSSHERCCRQEKKNQTRGF